MCTIYTNIYSSFTRKTPRTGDKPSIYPKVIKLWYTYTMQCHSAIKRN